VLPARIFAHTPHGGAVELLLLKRLDKDEWEVMVKPGKKARPGATLTVNEELSVTVEAVLEEGLRRVRFHYEGVFEDILSRVGTMPLPPYIREKLDDQARYQTVYGKINGSAAAPTAGLHFTPDLLEKIKQKGVTVTQVLLHVGLGTFRPVKETNVQDHKMHSEYYEISEETAQIINCAKKEGRRVIAVGTTSVRTLETVADEQGMVQKASGETQIFLYPPYHMKCVDALITNFHLPKSTLIMLVATLTGREKILDLYNLAVAENYRFFSFGDAMFIE
jgi:S-adenosylmethionine:tRNA ribosyltransferase-isomerase